MRQKKTIHLIGIILISFMISVISISATEVAGTTNERSTEAKQQEVMDYGVSLFNWDNIGELQEQLKEALPSNMSFDLKQEVMSLLSGEKRFNLETILRLIGNMLFEEVGVFIKLGARFVLIVLLCNLLQTLSSSFKSKETTKICFFVCYLIIIYSVIQSFVVMIQLATQTIDYMRAIMLVCIPTLLAFMATMGYVTSSAAMAPVIMSALYLITNLIKQIVLPCIISVMILEILSTMSQEFKITRFIKLFYSGIKWVLGTIVALSISLLGAYRATLPILDVTVKKTALKLTTAFIPILGNATSGALEFISACTSLIKNTFAIGVILWIVILVSVPLIKILAYIIVYQFAGAVIEPIGDKKMASIASKLAKGCQFIMSAVGIVAILCISVLLICMSVGGHVA